jgi:hypothetical protein
MSLFSLSFFIIIVLLVVQCDIYKSSYSISQLNSSPPSFSFTPPPQFLQQCQHVSFFNLHICIHNISTTSTLLDHFLISSLLPLVPISQTGSVFAFLFSVLVKKMKFLFVCIQGVSL